MPWYDSVWNPGVDGNAAHIAEHGIDVADVEFAVCSPIRLEESHATGRPIAIGLSLHGKIIAVVYEHIDPITVYPITAFEVEE